MYPNPAQHTLSLELMDADLDLSSYEIMDNTGRMVSAGSLAGMKNDISIESLKPGVYFISVQTNRGSATSRFIKQ